MTEEKHTSSGGVEDGQEVGVSCGTRSEQVSNVQVRCVVEWSSSRGIWHAVAENYETSGLPVGDGNCVEGVISGKVSVSIPT